MHDFSRFFSEVLLTVNGRQHVTSLDPGLRSFPALRNGGDDDTPAFATSKQDITLWLLAPLIDHEATGCSCLLLSSVPLLLLIVDLRQEVGVVAILHDAAALQVRCSSILHAHTLEQWGLRSSSMAPIYDASLDEAAFRSIGKRRYVRHVHGRDSGAPGHIFACIARGRRAGPILLRQVVQRKLELRVLDPVYHITQWVKAVCTFRCRLPLGGQALVVSPLMGRHDSSTADAGTTALRTASSALPMGRVSAAGPCQGQQSRRAAWAEGCKHP
mmetsp:Transcript_21431/g.47527  ORF Transcript_21431/g.47527 Transcript_21431/m.47527 type:complete len:272 (+) Transcript_21431:782-1597(+)